MNISEIARKMTISIIIIGLVSILASIIYYRSLDFLPFLLGVLIGSTTSILKVYLLKRAVDKALTMEEGKGKNYIALQHILRLGLSAVALLIGALFTNISIWGVVVGILAFQASTYIANFTNKNKNNIKKQEETNS